MKALRLSVQDKSSESQRIAFLQTCLYSINPGLQTGYELCYIVPTLQKGVDRQWRADTSLVEERHGMASEN